MKKPTIKFAGKQHPFSSSELGKDWKYSVRPGGWVVAESPEGERHRFMLSETKGKFSASISGLLFLGEVQQDRGHGVGPEGGGDSDLTAEFPGKVRKILVEAGQAVKTGEPLVLVEAMKMEFTIKAPFDGTVKEVFVIESQQLSPGDRFLDMTPLTGEEE